VDISPEAQNTQGSLHKPHETQEGLPKCEYLILLRRGKKIPMERVTETKFRAETEEMIIQKLPHLGIHPTNNHQIQTLLQMPTRAC
jgi:Na+-translocating ferredoxin:NAD+ oxidoreductase RnfC subunit